MDDDIFRTYFVRLYKGITQMENNFIEVLENADKEEFLRFSDSLKDIAKHFKVHKSKEDKRNASPGAIAKMLSNPDKRELTLAKSLFGTSNIPKAKKSYNLTVSLLPTRVVGITRCKLEFKKKGGRRKKGDDINSDIFSSSQRSVHSSELSDDQGEKNKKKKEDKKKEV